MKLECKLKRVGGTDVDLPPDTIQFRPLDPTRADSPHVAEVSEVVAARLMAADARVYVPYEGKAPAKPLAAPKAPATPTPPPADSTQVVLLGSSTLPALIDLGVGAPVPLGTVVQEAFRASGLTENEWNDLSDEARDEHLNALIDAVRPKAPAAPVPPIDPASGDTNKDGVLSVRELKDGIKAGTLTHEQLRELMAAEEAAQEPRQSFIDVIVKALKS